MKNFVEALKNRQGFDFLTDYTNILFGKQN